LIFDFFGGKDLSDEVRIEQMDCIEEHLAGLSELLIKVVDDGASIGFLPPISFKDANNYWNNVCGPNVILLIAICSQQVAGTVQLHLSEKQNGTHRAEVAKLMTHPDFRRKGIGRVLMQRVEEAALHKERFLVVLDTREGDPSNRLYESLGYKPAGRIPAYAKSADGELAATIFYYKMLQNTSN
jgi:ribosomal protein S18 acetylase RimI-like enzyme